MTLQAGAVPTGYNIASCLTFGRNFTILDNLNGPEMLRASIARSQPIPDLFRNQGYV